MNHNYEWSEALPESCPPEEAYQCNGENFYRLVAGDPARESDFFSHRKLYPTRIFKVDECQARAVSVFSTKKEAEELRKKPPFKNKNTVIARVTIRPKDGVVAQTGHNKKHYSWWRTTAYDIAEATILYDNENNQPKTDTRLLR